MNCSVSVSDNEADDDVEGGPLMRCSFCRLICERKSLRFTDFTKILQFFSKSSSGGDLSLSAFRRAQL